MSEPTNVKVFTVFFSPFILKRVTVEKKIRIDGFEIIKNNWKFIINKIKV